MKPTFKKGKKLEPVNLESVNLVKERELQANQKLPLLIEPNLNNVNLIDWCQQNKEHIEERLLSHGGILLRGFEIDSINKFEGIVDTVCEKPMEYSEGATPRTKLSKKSYTSTEFPPEHPIFLHNELSYVNAWPRKIVFYCDTPSLTGGETPIADVRKVYDRIAPEIRDEFKEKQWMLVRNFGDGFGLSWQEVFHTESKMEVEQYCDNNNIEYYWKGNNKLRTTQIRPAITSHPITNEPLWFNHLAFWHESTLDAEVQNLFQKEFGKDNLPYNTYYGDGTSIDKSVIDHIVECYEKETVYFKWKKGDVLVLDNMLVAHGRSSFTGERKVLVSMGEPVKRVNNKEVTIL